MSETTLAYIDTRAITNDAIRAAAGVPTQCVGYPDGVPETWRTPSRLVSSLQLVPENAGKHFMNETRDRIADLEYIAAAHSEHLDDIEESLRRGAVLLQSVSMGGAGGGSAHPEGDFDPAALLGPVGEPVEWPEWKRETLRKILAEDDYPIGGIPLDDDDGAGDWPEWRAPGDEEC